MPIWLSPVAWANMVVAAVTSVTSRLTNFGEGSASGGLVNAAQSVGVAIQNAAQFIVSICRAATSNGAWLASFIADYYCPPPSPATFAGGTYSTAPLLFGNYQNAPVGGWFIPAGTAGTATLNADGTYTYTPPTGGVTVQNNPPIGTPAKQFMVVADATNPNYNAGLGGYVIQSGTASVVATVQAMTQGAESNIVAGSLVVIVTPGTPAAYISQTQDIENGQDGESDPAVRVRFQKYISSLAKGTSNAIDAAVLGVQSGLSYTNNDRLDALGNPATAFFTIVVDDGSGAISPTTLASVVAAINGTNTNPPTPARAEGIGFAVIAPQNVEFAVSLVGTIAQPGFDLTAVRAALASAIQAWLNAAGVGSTGYANATAPPTPGFVTYLGLLDVINGFIGTQSGQGLLYAGTVTLQGGSSDVPVSPYQLPRASNLTISVV